MLINEIVESAIFNTPPRLQLGISLTPAKYRNLVNLSEDIPFVSIFAIISSVGQYHLHSFITNQFSDEMKVYSFQCAWHVHEIVDYVIRIAD